MGTAGVPTEAQLLATQARLGLSSNPGEERLGLMANGALAIWGRELDLRETEVQLMEQLTVSWSEPVAHELEDIRKQLLALGYEAENLLSSRTKPAFTSTTSDFNDES